MSWHDRARAGRLEAKDFTGSLRTPPRATAAELADLRAEPYGTRLASHAARRDGRR